jgi:ABC-type transport system substrate-binding protein
MIVMRLHVLALALVASVAIASPVEAAAKKHKKAKAVHRENLSAVQSKPHRNDVYSSGEYVGRDPDPSIRLRMIRNPRDWDGPD